ncbi:MAG TPA: ABC transporter family substrate-binding protein [Natronosporangium sp.]
MRITKRLASFAAVGLSATLALTACAGEEGGSSGDGAPSWDACADDPNGCNSGEPAPGGEIVWAFEQEQASWNNLTSSGNTFALSQMLDKILVDTGEFLPDGSWAWDLDLLQEEPQLVSEDPQSWTYRIRPEAKWSDGTDITVDDFIFLWRHNSGDPEHCTECNPASSAGFSQIESIEGTDNGKTVTVTLKPGEKFAEWQFLFTDMYPAHVAEAQGFDLDTPEGMTQASQYFAETQPTWSGGPYQVAQADLRQQIILEPNPNWYGEGPVLETVTYRIITEQDALVTALNSGEIDGSRPQPNPDMVQQIDAMEGMLSYVDAGYEWEHIDLNLENQWLRDVELRRAIFTAIDVNNVLNRTVASFYPDAEPKTNYLFLPNSEYHQDHITGTGHGSGDVQAAMDILTAAGYTLEGDQLMTPEGEPVGPLRFVHTEGNQLRATTAQLVQENLAEIGIPVTIETTADLGATLASGDFDIMIFAWVGSPAFQASGQQFWDSESDSNFGHYSNPEVDRLVREALNQSDLAAVADLLNQAQAIVASEAYSLPLLDRPVYAFVRDDYVNVRPNFTNEGVPYNIHEWGLAASAE